MPQTRFRNLASIGVITDVPPSDLPVNAWTDALNVRFNVGKISDVGGWDIVSKASVLGDQTPLAVVKAPLSQGQYFYASNKFVYSCFPNPNYDPSDPTSSAEKRYNVTPRDATGVAIPDYDAQVDLPINTKVQNITVSEDSRWNSTRIAERVVLNAPNLVPISQPDGDFDPKAAFTALPGWGKPVSDSTSPNYGIQLVWRAERMHAYKDHLLALNMTESTSFSNPNTTAKISNRIRWSHYAFENQVPQNWFDDGGTDVEPSDGGFVDLMDATSPILDGAPLRDYFMVYTNTETYIFNYTGGSDIFTNEKVFNDSGILAAGCVAEYDGKHYVVTADDIIVHDGSQKKSIIQGTVRDRVLNEISAVNSRATRVYANPIMREVWICYPWNSTNTPNPAEWACSRAAIYNVENQTWTFADIPDIYDASMAEIIDKTPLADWDVGSALQPTKVPWDGQALPWEVNTVRLGNSKFFAASGKHCLLNLDVGDEKYEPVFTDVNTDPTQYVRTSNGFVQRFVERQDIDMDEEVPEIGRVKTWRTIYPQMFGQGVFSWTISGYDYPGGQVKTRAPSTFTVGQNYKIDLLFSKRYINVRIETTGSSDWEFSTYDVDYVVEGRR